MSAEDLYKLKLWRESEPEAPDGPELSAKRGRAGALVTLDDSFIFMGAEWSRP